MKRAARRNLLAAGVAAVTGSLSWTHAAHAQAQRATSSGDPGREALRKAYDAAVVMKQQAQSSGDQPYGAVVVVDGEIAGEGASRVVKDNNPNAHAERVAIREAQRRLARQDLRGAILVSTSRPCSLCEEAAAQAGIARMVHGADLTDAGAPRTPNTSRR